MMRVGLVGCGTIGSQLAGAIQRDYPAAARLVALHDVDRGQAEALQRLLPVHPPIVSLPELIRRSDVILEAASPAAVRRLLPPALRAHRTVFVMSVGGLLQDRSWQRLLRRSRGRIVIPSGALAGLDGVKALAMGRVLRASLTTRKPPRAFAASPYVIRRGLKLSALRRPTVLFEGPPRRVVEAFPQNTNVAAALTLALGRSRTTPRIRVVADPTIRINIHELTVEGDCGRICTSVRSRPSANPKTSELAVRSALATLQRLFDPVLLGT